MADFSMSQNSTPEQEQQTTTSSSNTFFIPIIFSFSSQSTDPNQETNGSSDQVVMIGGFLNQDMMMMMMIPPSLKDGPLPASKASIEAMRKIEITENNQELGEEECSICFNGWKIGEEVKEMPCKHRYHSNCIEKWLRIHGCCPLCRFIEKWLRIHGCCPLCRFKMPIDEEEEIKNTQEIGTRIELSEEETRSVMDLLLGLLMQSNNNNNNQEQH